MTRAHTTPVVIGVATACCHLDSLQLSMTDDACPQNPYLHRGCYNVLSTGLITAFFYRHRELLQRSVTDAAIYYSVLLPMPRFTTAFYDQ